MRTCVAVLRSAGLEIRLKSKNSVGARSALKRVSYSIQIQKVSLGNRLGAKGARRTRRDLIESVTRSMVSIVIYL